MKKFFFFLLIVAIAALLAWKFIFKKETKNDGPKPEGMAVSEHSSDFNTSMKKALDDYYNLSEAFVNWDTVGVSSALAAFKTSIDSLGLEEMKKDSAIYPTVESYWESIKSEISGIALDSGLYAKREDLNSLSQQLYDLLRIVKYDAAKVYYHECPMALNNYENSAFWLSDKGEMKERRNPYLGLHDPKFGRSMLTCGSTRDSINFIATSSK